MKLLFTYLFIISTSIIYAQSSIKGTVKTSDGLPAEFVNIGLKGTSKSVEVGSDGGYEIKNVKPGSYILITSFVGLESIELPVSVTSETVTTVPDIVLKQSALQLKEVMIVEYESNNEKSVVIGKAPIKLMDLPQSVASINDLVLEQQQISNMTEAVKNFNGVYIMGTSGGYQEELAGRGFAYGSNNTFKNGIRFNNTAMPEMSALESVEIMKGSAAILFGNVAAGGVINLVTKKPHFENGGKVSLNAKSYDYYEPTIDVYGSLNKNKTVAFRVNSVFEKSRSFRDVVKSERIYINPSLLFKLGKKTELLIEGDYLNDDRTADFGIGAIDYTLIDIPRNRFIGVEWSYYKTAQQSTTATLTHYFNKNWQIRGVSSFQKFNSDLFANQRPNGNSQFIKANGMWIRGIQRTKVDEEYSIAQLDVTGKFKTAFLQHTLLLGADVDKYNTSTIAFNPISQYDTVNVFDLSKYKQRKDIPDLTRRALTSAPVSRAGIYIQDLISLTDKIKLLAGVRFSYLDIVSKVYTYSNETTITTLNYDHAFSPRFGLVYQPIATIACFASYANSFTTNTGIDVNGEALPPSIIDQYEIGIKKDILKGFLSANVTIYQIKNSNLAQTSLAEGNTNSNIKELAGEVTSKGLEVDISSKEWKGLSLIAGYSYNNTRYTKSNTYIVGSQLRYNPNNTANASLYYKLNNLRIKCLSGFNTGLGVVYIGERMAGRSTRLTVANDTYKLISLPSYTIVEASLGYVVNNISVRIKMSNIFDVLNYNVHDDNSVNPISPRQFTLTLTHKF